jgi:hypothetical protein
MPRVGARGKEVTMGQKQYSGSRSDAQASSRVTLVPTRRPNIWRIDLDLDHEQRHIGVLDTSGPGTLRLKRNEQQIHRKTNSLGINEELCERFNFRWIKVDLGGTLLQTTMKFFLAHSRVFTFSKAGFEKQRFMALSDWGLDKALEFESRVGAQEQLFPTGVAA